MIPTHVGRGLRPEIIVHQFPPKVRTYLKSTTGIFLVPARTNIAVKLLTLNWLYEVRGGGFVLLDPLAKIQLKLVRR
jgi:hypothetical protein